MAVPNLRPKKYTTGLDILHPRARGIIAAFRCNEGGLSNWLFDSGPQRFRAEYFHRTAIPSWGGVSGPPPVWAGTPLGRGFINQTAGGSNVTTNLSVFSVPYYQSPVPEVYRPTYGFTIAVTSRAYGGTGNRTMASGEDIDTVAGWGLRCEGTQVRFYIRGSDATWHEIVVAGVVTQDAYIRWVGTFNTGEGSKLYKDGVLIGTNTTSIGKTVVYGTKSGFNVCGNTNRTNNANAPWNGEITEVIFSSDCWSPSMVMQDAVDPDAMWLDGGGQIGAGIMSPFSPVYSSMFVGGF